VYNTQAWDLRCDSKVKVSPYFVVFVFIMVVSFVGLGVLRLYANRLEARLNEINLQIESYEMQEVDMRRALSTLTSPEAIYGYSQKKLGMIANVRSEKVHVAMSPPLHQSQKTMASSVRREHRLGFLFSLFSSQATAKE
jgi:hypothetical protein